MEKRETRESFVSDTAGESETRVESPKEIRNWRIYLYCIGVCFGSVALGYASPSAALCILSSSQTDTMVTVMTFL
jgi:hypothetical protein